MKINTGKIKSIKLFGKTHFVKFVDGEDWSMNGAGERYCGRIDHGKNEILIKRGATNEQVLDTLLHEIFHIIDIEIAMNIPETKITQLATAMSDLLLSNEWRA